MLKGVCVGAGYFSRFQYEAWNRIPRVKITALCNRDIEKGNLIANEFNISNVYSSFEKMLDAERPDFVDIITPPHTHYEFCSLAIERNIPIICQKPLSPTIQDSIAIVAMAEHKKTPFMVHENFRFQPWYREIKKILVQKLIGDNIFSAYFRMRTGDGWGKDAYLDRQPYFRNMSRLLVYETGIHFIDTFRYLFGEINSVYARLRKLNPIINGEDCGIIHFYFENGTQGLWDANRFNETNNDNPRYTFGEMLIEGDAGSIRLYQDGTITIQQLGCKETLHSYHHTESNFAGDCVFNTQQSFILSLTNQQPFETSGLDYLRNIAVQEAAYQSNDLNAPVTIQYISPHQLLWENLQQASYMEKK
jgi:predicted dehydrogenase